MAFSRSLDRYSGPTVAEVLRTPSGRSCLDWAAIAIGVEMPDDEEGVK
jgi:hypothetical protein